MAYSDFTLGILEEKFGITTHRKSLFEMIEPIKMGTLVQEALDELKTLQVRSEKAKSEWIVVPILRELRKRNNQYFTIYSGEALNVDKDTGLQGECDFILAKDIQSLDINYPIVQIVEAKKHDVEIGIPQCIAQLVGAKIYNEKKKTPLSKIYGCVTTGDDWLFMFLQENAVFVDTKRYYLAEVETILGVFQTIIDYYKKELK
ncbi:MAG: hypothetical protein MUE30_09660 [Spirosomaceae bacterium]|jgi:hypothetical protein|nr:hypothetical protein [Spirosomataceae bacterium]